LLTKSSGLQRKHPHAGGVVLLALFFYFKAVTLVLVLKQGDFLKSKKV
jgi:hypothetical protein